MVPWMDLLVRFSDAPIQFFAPRFSGKDGIAIRPAAQFRDLNS